MFDLKPSEQKSPLTAQQRAACEKCGWTDHNSLGRLEIKNNHGHQGGQNGHTPPARHHNGPTGGVHVWSEYHSSTLVTDPTCVERSPKRARGPDWSVGRRKGYGDREGVKGKT